MFETLGWMTCWSSCCSKCTIICFWGKSITFRKISTKLKCVSIHYVNFRIVVGCHETIAEEEDAMVMTLENLRQSNNRKQQNNVGNIINNSRLLIWGRSRSLHRSARMRMFSSAIFPLSSGVETSVDIQVTCLMYVMIYLSINFPTNVLTFCKWKMHQVDGKPTYVHVMQNWYICIVFWCDSMLDYG